MTTRRERRKIASDGRDANLFLGDTIDWISGKTFRPIVSREFEWIESHDKLIGRSLTLLGQGDRWRRPSLWHGIQGNFREEKRDLVMLRDNDDFVSKLVPISLWLPKAKKGSLLFGWKKKTKKHQYISNITVELALRGSIGDTPDKSPSCAQRQKYTRER